MIHASKQKRYKHIGDGITAISILVAVILGGSALQRNALLVEQLDELQAAHSGRIDELQAAHSGRIDELNATLARHAAWIQEQEEKVTVVQSTGVALPMVQPDAMPPCSSESPTPSIVYTHSALLDMDVMQTCSSMEGVSAWRSVMTLGGLIFDGTDPSAFASAVNSGLPGVYVLRLGEGGVEYAVDEAITVHQHQDVRVVSTVAGIDDEGKGAGEGAEADDGDAGGEASAGAQQGQPSLTFKSTVHVQANAMLSLSEDLNNLTFVGALNVKPEAALAIASSRHGMTLTFRGMVTVGTNAELTVSGNVHVPYVGSSLGLWHCTAPEYVQGTCTLSGRVTVAEYDSTVLHVAGTLPGTWTAVSAPSDDSATPTAVGTVFRSNGGRATWLPQDWHLHFGRRWQSGAVTNKLGHSFNLYLMSAPLPFSNSDEGYEMYAAVCASAGLKMVVSGSSSYFEDVCGDDSNICMPLPDGTDRTGQYWGSTTDVDDYIHEPTTWDDFVILSYDAKRPYNYPGGTVGFGTPKRAVCGREISLDIRLMDGETVATESGRGRLELRSEDDRAWSTVCDDAWDGDDCTVACRQLGFQGCEVIDMVSGAASGGQGFIRFDDMACSGSESSLYDCDKIVSEPGTDVGCSHSEDIGIQCSN